MLSYELKYQFFNGPTKTEPITTSFLSRGGSDLHQQQSGFPRWEPKSQRRDHVSGFLFEDAGRMAIIKVQWGACVAALPDDAARGRVLATSQFLIASLA
jgi:hypothetical protein